MILPSPPLVESENSGWNCFAEPAVKFKTCRIFGVIYVGFASYANNATIRSYVEIGRYYSIGRDVVIGLGHHDYMNISTSSYFEKFSFNLNPIKLAQHNPKRRVKIGNDVWIGDRAMIISGINIGDGAVIGAGSIVTKDVPPYSIVVGSPARIIKNRFSDEIIDEFLKIKYWQYDPIMLKGIMEDCRSIYDFFDKFHLLRESLKIFDINYLKIFKQ